MQQRWPQKSYFWPIYLPSTHKSNSGWGLYLVLINPLCLLFGRKLAVLFWSPLAKIIPRVLLGESWLGLCSLEFLLAHRKNNHNEAEGCFFHMSSTWLIYSNESLCPANSPEYRAHEHCLLTTPHIYLIVRGTEQPKCAQVQSQHLSRSYQDSDTSWQWNLCIHSNSHLPSLRSPLLRVKSIVTLIVGVWDLSFKVQISQKLLGRSEERD